MPAKCPHSPACFEKNFPCTGECVNETSPACSRCDRGTTRGPNGEYLRCAYCQGTGRTRTNTKGTRTSLGPWEPETDTEYDERQWDEMYGPRAKG
jgi:hypothetical protein